MVAFFQRHRSVILLVVLVGASFWLISLDLRNPERTLIVEKAVMAAVGPLQSVTSAGYRFVSRGIGTYVALVDTKKENRRLRERLSRLEAERVRLIEAAKQEERLRKMLHLEESARFKLVVCTVIGVDAARPFSSIFIDRGHEEGLAINMPVITYAGVVGKVVKLSGHVARVQLLTDTKSSIAVLVQRSRAAGILRGNGSGVCEMAYIDAEADVRRGDTVLTSGLGGIYPRGLRVGTVRSVVKRYGCLTKTALVLPHINVGQLEEVYVVIGERTEELERLRRENW